MRNKSKFSLAKILKFIVLNLPKFIRDPIIRSQLNINYNGVKDLVIKTAETEEELEGALRVLHDTYVDTGLADKSESGMRITKYHLLPSTTNIIAKYKGQVIATISIFHDGPLGLPADKFVNLKKLRSQGKRLVEISSLAITKSNDFRGSRVYFPMVIFMYLFCKK
tara:strand:+ start:3419 stop:3916 length:498 start_codon:yes stop_codon:yes gene_type:complete